MNKFKIQLGKNTSIFYKNLAPVMERLGGVLDAQGYYVFPSHITESVLNTVFDNSCKRCGGLLEDSTALLNTNASSNDFGNDAGQRGTTQSRIGIARMVSCKKCKECGHSFVGE